MKLYISNKQQATPIEKVKTLANGLEIWQVKSLVNGELQLAYFDTQVLQTLKDNGYKDNIISQVMPTDSEIDWLNSINLFNKQFKQQAKTFAEVNELMPILQAERAKELGLTETASEFIALVDNLESEHKRTSERAKKHKMIKIPIIAPPTEEQLAIRQELRMFNTQMYVVSHNAVTSDGLAMIEILLN